MKKFNYLYKISNLVNGKYYIGIHSTNNFEDGYMGSGNLIKESIKKYGKENHMREILEYFDTREELAKREQEIVNLDEIAKKECMNLITGGDTEFGISHYKNIKDVKTRLISFRLDKHTLNKIEQKLIENNINLSEYVRRLIENDFSN